MHACTHHTHACIHMHTLPYTQTRATNALHYTYDNCQKCLSWLVLYGVEKAAANENNSNKSSHYKHLPAYKEHTVYSQMAQSQMESQVW